MDMKTARPVWMERAVIPFAVIGVPACTARIL